MADNATNSFNWQEAFQQTFDQFTQQVINYAPQIFGCIAILVLGWIIAKVLSISTRKLVHGLDHLFKRVAKADSLNRERMKQSYASIAGLAVFWVVFLFFIAVAANILGWAMFSGWMDSVVNYLPGLLTGLLIIMAGFLVSNLAHTAIQSATINSGATQSAAMARSVQVVILFSAIIIGVEQIGLSVDFLSNFIVVISGTLLGGAALAFALGAKTMVANIIGAQYTRKHCRVGEIMRIGEVEGEIIEVTQSCIVLDTGNGRAIVPASMFQQQVSQLSSTTNQDPAVNPVVNEDT